MLQKTHHLTNQSDSQQLREVAKMFFSIKLFDKGVHIYKNLKGVVFDEDYYMSLAFGSYHLEQFSEAKENLI